MELYKIFLQKHACVECREGREGREGRVISARGGKTWSKAIRPLCTRCYKSYSNYCKQDLARRLNERGQDEN